ncbi:hypothetical protein NXF25_018965 [Crotalus adamanteus]|uniref:Secreted protein n=1 Tax=Crotalus adamanteus TaxID=8729 RepID=A0AAW1B144_CROAD
MILVAALGALLLYHLALHHCCLRSAVLLTVTGLLSPSPISPLLSGLCLQHTASAQMGCQAISQLGHCAVSQLGHLSAGLLGCLSAGPPLSWATSHLFVLGVQVLFLFTPVANLHVALLI